MRIRLRWVIVAAILFLNRDSPALYADKVSTPRNNQIPATRLSLQSYLAKMSLKLNFHYTVETDGRDITRPLSSRVSSAVVEDASIPTVEAFVAKLQLEFPEVEITQDATNRAIVHVIDKSLRQWPDYPLNKKLNLGYSGNVRGLVDELSRRLENRIRYPQVFYAGGGPIRLFGDTTTLVDIVADDLDVRQILSHGLPLSRYSRLLWSARTLSYQGKTETWVQHSGPLDPNVAFLWTDAERMQMRKALIALKQERYQEALSGLRLLYEKAPYQKEYFELDDVGDKGLFSLPGTLVDYTVSGLLYNAFYKTKQYPKALAVASASVYQREGRPISRISEFDSGFIQKEKKQGTQFSPAVAVDDVWVDFAPEPVLKNGTVFVPLVHLARHLKLEVVHKRDESTIVVRQKQPPQQWTFNVGSSRVNVTGQSGVTLKEAPFRQEDKIMISVSDFASVLKGKVHWFPDEYLLHAVFSDETK